MKPLSVFEKLQNHKFNDSCCFLCGSKLHSKNHTEEHVFPRWLQNMFNLWDQKISLLNDTLIPYRQLTIPCCLTCNNKFLKPIEDKIFCAVKLGYDEFVKLDKLTIFYWLGKIYFGLMYKELFLSYNRKSKDKFNTITTKQYLEIFFAHHLFLQGIRGQHKFENFFPASIWILKTQKPVKIENQWDFFDGHNTMFISCRMADIGIISVLQDVQITENYQDFSQAFSSISLHPIQFREIVAKAYYMAMLIDRTPKFINIEQNNRIHTTLLPIMGLSLKPILKEGNNDEYAIVLSEITSIPLSEINPEKGAVWTWLYNSENDPIFIDVKKN